MEGMDGYFSMATPSRTNPDYFSRVVHGILCRRLFGHALVDPRFQERPTDKAVRSQFGWFFKQKFFHRHTLCLLHEAITLSYFTLHFFIKHLGTIVA
jgi:hypothetical protein